MTINTNLNAIDSHRNIKTTFKASADASYRLSSGVRVNSAADDAAALAISEKMRSQIRGLDQAERNSANGEALVRVADGALQEAQNIVHRMRELAVQSCNDTNSNEDRQKLNEEYKQLCDELDRIAEGTEYNKKKLFTGEYAKELFAGLDYELKGIEENDAFNGQRHDKATITQGSNIGSANTVFNPIDPDDPSSPEALEDEDWTPKAQFDRNDRRPPRAVGNLTGDRYYNAGTVNAGNNTGGKIWADDGTDVLVVNDNTSYKDNIDGSYYYWQEQRREWIPGYYDSNNNWIAGYYTAWTDYGAPQRFGTIEDHSDDRQDGGIAATPQNNPNSSSGRPGGYYEYQYVGPIMDTTGPYAYYQPTPKDPTGDTQNDYDRDEWERAEIYSEARVTTVGSNKGGAIYVRNDANGTETNVGDNTANTNYYLGGTDRNARIDTNTHKVTVTTNGADATVVSRNKAIGSQYTTTTNSGRIYTASQITKVETNNNRVDASNQDSGSTYDSDLNAGTAYVGAEETTVEINTGTLHVNSNAGTDSVTKVTRNSGGFIRTNSFTTVIESHNSGTIDDTNGASGSTFTLKGAGTSNSGTIKTAAEKVDVDYNNGTLHTTASGPNSELNVINNTGFISTKARTVNITGTNNGQLRLDNAAATATIAATGTNSRIDTSADSLTINGNASGQIAVRDGASVVVNGASNSGSVITIDSGGEMTINGDMGGNMTVKAGATLVVTGEITGTLFVEAGANVSFTGDVKGRIVFLGDPANIDPNPINVAAGGIVELRDTNSIDIGENNGTVRVFRSTTTIDKNNARVEINNDTTASASVGTNNGNILNLGKLAITTYNYGTIDNWNTIQPPISSSNNSTATVRHYIPSHNTNTYYDVSEIPTPTVVNGELNPPVQWGILKLYLDGVGYMIRSQWEATEAINPDNIKGRCDCDMGVHTRNECADLERGLIKNAFELRFDLNNLVPLLPTTPVPTQGEEFVILNDYSLNVIDSSFAQYGGIRYDIEGGKAIVYNVDVRAVVTENWEEGNGIYVQTGPNSKQGFTIYIPKLGEGMDAQRNGCVFCDCGTLKAANLLTRQNSTIALDVCDTANDKIAEVRATIGAQQNRLIFTQNAVAIASQNLMASESRIRDADMALERMKLAKNEVLAQAAVSMLSQANQEPQDVLQLLRA